MTIATDAVEERLKQILLAVLNDEVDVSQIHSGVALVEEGLSLDSVALLHFVVRIENEFQIMLDDGALTREHFESLRSLARAVEQEITRQSKA